MALPSPDNPIHRMSTFEFASKVEEVMMPMVGGRPHSSGQHHPDGTIESTHPSPRKWFDEVVHVEKATAPPDDPLNRDIGMHSSFMRRHQREDRKKNGLRIGFTGGVAGAFGDLHIAFIGTGGSFGAALDESKLGENDAQKERIQKLIGQWTDKLPPEERRKKMMRMEPDDAPDYAQQLAEELASLKKVPLKLRKDGKVIHVEVDNAQVGDDNTCLAQVLFGVGKNARDLTTRPMNEVSFITKGASNFSNILKTTDRVEAFIRGQLEAQGMTDAKKIMRESGLAFDSERAERILLKHAPYLKLHAVMAPLVGGYGSDASELLQLVGESVPTHPPVQNAEHGARLIEALLASVENQLEYWDKAALPKGLSKENPGFDAKAIKTYVRQSAMERPFDVARLAENAEVKKLLDIVRLEANSGYKTAYNDDSFADVRRGVETFDRAVAEQKKISDKAEAVKKATSYKATRWDKVKRVFGAKIVEREEGNTSKAIASGMNRDEMSAMMEEIVAAFMKDTPPKMNFSEMIAEQMAARAARAKADVPPLP